MQQDHGSRLKLALWCTRTFRPIISHRHLESIMSSLGFVGLPPSTPITCVTTAWREYVYPAGRRWMSRLQEGQQPPNPRLPHPRIDGLHVSTYQTFIDAVNFYLERDDVSAIFHVRGMPLIREDYIRTGWCEIGCRGEGDGDGDGHGDGGGGGSCFLYRIGTLVTTTFGPNNLDKERAEDRDNSRLRFPHNKEGSDNDSPKYHRSNLVPLTDINATIARQSSQSFGWSMSLDAPNQATDQLLGT
ncbi:hypothetical protein CDL15_Pgr004472 [Punica granatum]|uniref:Uncharacterized protein n=1 Tax=Punica granatum TaxID=22663 RepID=A0A218XH08_PUNGR|nr:hypothetical protein CDL15_Pgr004472 [Punica granatum]PKI75804.1 hypothetical protein CRG98_003847 [Punica granatum]